MYGRTITPHCGNVEALCLLGAVIPEGGVVAPLTTVVFGPSDGNACLR